jgi:hypothetical protein
VKAESSLRPSEARRTDAVTNVEQPTGIKAKQNAVILTIERSAAKEPVVRSHQPRSAMDESALSCPHNCG